MKKFLIILLPAFFWATSDALTRVFSGKINSILGTFLLAVGMVISLIIVMIFIPNISKEISTTNLKFAGIALFAGLINATGFFLFVKFLEKGGNFTQGMPIILVGIVVFVTLYGIIFFKDPLTLKTGIGLVLAAGAIYFLAH